MPILPLRNQWRRLGRLVASRVELLRMLGQASPGLVAAAVLCAAIAGLLPVGLIIAGGLLSQRIADAVGAGASSSLGPVVRAFIVVICLFLLSEIIAPVQGRLRWLITKQVDGAMRVRVMRAALSGSDLTHLHGADYLEAMGESQGLIRWSATPGAGAAGVVGVATDYLSGIAAAVVLAVFTPILAAATLAVALFMRVQWRRAVLRIVDVWGDGVRDRREAWYLTDLGLGRPALSEVRLFGLRDWLGGRIAAAGIRSWIPTWEQRRAGMGRNGIVHLVVPGSMALMALGWAARATADGRLSIGALVVVVPALFATLSIGTSFRDDMAVEYGLKALPSVGVLEREAQRITETDQASATTSPRGAPRVELRAVSFGYPGGDTVLSGIDLAIPAGSSAALVGLNGAGKTTLVRLLCGLYPPTQGAVLIDGVDLHEISLDVWHRHTAAMFQGFVRWPGTLFENVATGSVEHLDDDEGVRAALAEARAAVFADRLPDGVDSELATPHADGTDLSGGQWQRLALARALQALRHGARFMVLDEPTSNLDTAAEERLVRRLIEETTGDVTTVLVTHRLALARRCDQIVVLEEGRVAERGSHDELMRLGGRYANAFGMQASMYPLEDSSA